MSENAPYIVFYGIAAVFVASALVARRIPMGQAARMALAWIAIFLMASAIAVAIGAF